MRFMTLADGDQVRFPVPGAAEPERVHVFCRAEIDAVNAALGAGRPLLVRGEPGSGKTQLAEAVALHLGRVLLPFVVDARSESRDLLWHLDAVQRLADAQLLGAAGARRPVTGPAEPPMETAAGEGRADPGVRGALDTLRRDLALEYYLHPGPLWWAFDWDGARAQADRARLPPPSLTAPEHGALVLIDEIDKAESDLPNGLLEALGARSFTPHGRAAPVCCRGEPPLVIVTTNEERALPDAFIRRCLVLHLRLPDATPARLAAHLVGRGRAHFPAAPAAVLETAAGQLAADRAVARDNQWYPLPGQAEYLDLVRAALALATPSKSALDWLTDLRCYVLRKHPDAAPEDLAGDTGPQGPPSDAAAPSA